MYQTLLTELEQGILTVTVNRPDKLNALNRSVLDDLDKLMDQVESDSTIRGVILTGAGPKAFVAGADISEFTELSKEQAMQLAKRGQDCFFRIERSSKPIIAAVNGFALGGGCELAMSCHIRLASENARFGQPEVNLGLIPGYGGTQRLTQLVGKGDRRSKKITDHHSYQRSECRWTCDRCRACRRNSHHGRLRRRNTLIWRMLRHRGSERGGWGVFGEAGT